MLLGHGALANYHDLALKHRGDFEFWHTTEHVPERTATPGFMRGRRYIAVHGSPQYFILYEGSSVEVFSAQAYLERLNNPTPWTSRVSATMTRTLRTACVVTETLGQGTGDLCGTWRLAPRGNRATLRDRFVHELLPLALDVSDCLSVHLLEADAAVTRVDTLEKGMRQGADEMSDWIVMIEGDSIDGLDAAHTLLSHNLATPLNESDWSVYQLQAMQRDINEL